MRHNHLNATAADFDPQNEWVECPECRSVMHMLANYELPASSEYPAVEAELWELVLYGWIIVVYNFLAGLLTYGIRKRKLTSLKQQVLPRYPHSLVCPRCLTVSRRP